MQPDHFELLCDDDRRAYLALQSRFRDSETRSRKGERLDVFMEGLQSIRAFIERDGEGSCLRALVCGVMFLGEQDELAVNVQKLRVLMGKCKSSLNGSLQRLGYSADPPNPEAQGQLTSHMPFGVGQTAELKKWSVRRKTELKPEPPAKPFVIQVPLAWRVSVDTEAVEAIAHRTFPCPVKCRYKYLDIIHRSVSIQTEA